MYANNSDMKITTEIYHDNEQCPLFKFCNAKTAICRVQKPDRSCYYYRYFEKLINEQGDNKNVL